jgi:ribosomal-protein-alanine N-acetyltransferase
VIPDGYHVRQLDQSDAEAMAAAYQRNVAHLGPWEPIRPDTFYTVSGQREAIEQRLEDQRQGRAASWVVVHGEAVVGQVTLSNVARGVFQSCAVGYWVDGGHTGRGLGTVLLEMACQSASSWGLHRVEAATLVSNGPSQAVLAKCGFALIGSAPAYLFIAGRWHDHRLYQRVLHDRPPGLDL